MNRWLKVAGGVALLLVAWQYRGSHLAQACSAVVNQVVPAQSSVTNVGRNWRADQLIGERPSPDEARPASNPALAFCDSLIQRP